MSTVPATQLQVINQMLRAINESPVSSLTGDVGVDVVTAKATLNDVMMHVQTEGWLFNTEFNYPLARNLDTTITVPANALSVNMQQQVSCDPVLRGTKVYDRMNHTYNFTADLTATIILGLPFEEMPSSARNYIAYRAARVFQDNSQGSGELHQYNESDELVARIRFMDDQATDEDLRFIR